MNSSGPGGQSKDRDWFRGLKEIRKLRVRPESPRPLSVGRDNGPGSPDAAVAAIADSALRVITGDIGLVTTQRSPSDTSAPPTQHNQFTRATLVSPDSTCSPIPSLSKDTQNIAAAPAKHDQQNGRSQLSSLSPSPAPPSQQVSRVTDSLSLYTDITPSTTVIGPIFEQDTAAPGTSIEAVQVEGDVSTTPLIPRLPRDSHAHISDDVQVSGGVQENDIDVKDTPAVKPGGPFKGSIAAHSSTSCGVKGALRTSMTFTQTLVKRLPDLVDGNPVKIALGLAKTIIEIKDAVKDNMDATERRIASTAEQLQILSDAQIDDWVVGNPDNPWLEKFRNILSEELGKLRHLGQGSMIKRIAAHELEKLEIAESFERINEARMQFELYTNIRVYGAVNRLVVAAGSFLFRLHPSHMADHRYLLEGEKREALYREICSPGTRISIVDTIVKWANDPDTQDIFCLFGPAGSGKTTIAYTIARRFDSTSDPDDTIILGGNFFCSRQFDETRRMACIIRTIAYQLAHKCKGFADALSATENIDGIIHRDVTSQLEHLLIGPWRQYRSALSLSSTTGTPGFLILLDALDEIVQDGSSIFLRSLLSVIGGNRLPGLKFFVTSRPDPDILSLLQGFERKRLLRLQDVTNEEARADVARYLDWSLPHFKGSDDMRGLQDLAGDLFICAATLVKHLSPETTSKRDQKRLIERLLCSTSAPTPSNATLFLDQLYLQLLHDAFSGVPEEFFHEKINILHTFLCTTEPTSSITVGELLNLNGFVGDEYSDEAELVQRRLHAVLYLDSNSNVLTYHKSFSDFIFDRSRSKQFACDEKAQQQLLADHCFRVMNAGLKFNIANIRSSFQLDCDNAGLQAGVHRNIPSELSYSCRNWSQHLTFTPCTNPAHSILDILSEFLRLRVLFWIEAMNLLRCVGTCEPALRTASTWAKECRPTLAQHLRQCGLFALYFAGSKASKSTPHLYVSALATWQEDDGPSVVWKRHFPRIPRFDTQGGRRSICLMVLDTGSLVCAVALSRKGEFIVTGTGDGLVQTWDARTGERLKRLEGHQGPVLRVAVSGDSTRVISASSDCSVRIWDAQTGQQLRVLEGEGPITSIAISRDGARVISGSLGGTVRVWNTQTGQQLKVSMYARTRIWDLASSDDLTRIAICGEQGDSVTIWDVEAGKPLWDLDGHRGMVHSVAYSADGTRVISGSSDGTVRVWDPQTGEQLKELNHQSAVETVAISRDGAHIISGGLDKSVKIWDMQTGERLRELQGHQQDVRCVAISEDNNRIVAGSSDATVRIWDAQRGERQREPQGHNSGITAVALSDDGTRLISGSSDGTLIIWDAQTGRQLKVLALDAGVQSAAMSGDSTRIVCVLGDTINTIGVWDVERGEQLKRLGHNNFMGTVTSIALSRDGARLVLAVDDGSVSVWDTRTWERKEMEHNHEVKFGAVALSEDGTHIASVTRKLSRLVDWSTALFIWSAQTGERLHQVKFNEGCVFKCLAFSEDGAYIASGATDGSVKIWDVQTGDELESLKGLKAIVLCAKFSRHGTRVFSGSYDGLVTIWDVQTGEQLEVLKGHAFAVTSIAISRDGTRAVSGSPDATIRIWDITKTTSQAISVSSVGHSTASSPTYTLEALEEDQLTGWVLSSDKGNRLMYVQDPTHLVIFPCISILSRRGSSSVDLEDAALGEEWEQCYDPSPIPSLCPP